MALCLRELFTWTYLKLLLSVENLNWSMFPLWLGSKKEVVGEAILV
jgi:hypothetical protein